MDKLHDDSAKTFCLHHPLGYVMPCVWSKIHFGSGAGTPIFVQCELVPGEVEAQKDGVGKLWGESQIYVSLSKCSC